MQFKLSNLSFLVSITAFASIAFAPACSSDDGPRTGTGGSSTGGATTGGSGTGGASTGGATTGGTSGVDNCPSPAAPASALIEDFEAGSTTAGWYAYVDADGTLDTSPQDGAEAGGPGSSTYAGHLAGSTTVPDPTGSDGIWAGTGKGLTSCTDVSDYGGVTFWARSDIAGFRLRLDVVTPGTHPTSDGGNCVDNCYDHFGKNFTLTDTWAEYSATFGELTQNSWGAPATFDDRVNNIQFSILGDSLEADGAFDFWVDDIEFSDGTGTGGSGSGGTSSGGAGGAGGGG